GAGPPFVASRGHPVGVTGQDRALRYDEGLPASVTALPRSPGSAVSQYSVLVTDRTRVMRHLAEAGIGTIVYYPHPLHRQPALEGRCRVTPTPTADHLAEHLLSLPIADCTNDDVDYVLAALHEATV
ncbi:MAG: DegT/DnrJ/EryC1/StrS family aminotransferase, partial [Myxococcota bacterium]